MTAPLPPAGDPGDTGLSGPGSTRDIAEVPALEIVSTAALHLMSAAAVNLGLAEDLPEHQDLDEDVALRELAQVVGLHDEGHRPGDVDQHRRRVVLHRGLRRPSHVHRHGSRLGVPAPQRRRARERQQRGAAVAPAHQHGGHVGGLVPRQPGAVGLLVVGHLAEHRDHRHQQPVALQHLERGGVQPVRVAVVRRQRRRQRGVGVAVVAREAGVGEVAHAGHPVSPP